MTKTKVAHTPGPWEVDYHHILRFRILAPGANKKKILITGLSEPDARLIAAAPELLEALKSLMSDVVTCYCANIGPIEKCSFCKGKAAIVKAEEGR